VEREDETVAKRALGEPVIVMRTFRAQHPGLERKMGVVREKSRKHSDVDIQKLEKLECQ